jgi:hypothetical protein
MAFLAQLYGVGHLTFAMLLWQYFRLADPHFGLAIVVSFILGDAVASVLSLAAVLSHVINAIGWAVAASHLLFAIGYSYGVFVLRES